MTVNIHGNFLTYKILVECFHVYPYNAPMFAQSSLKQATI